MQVVQDFNENNEDTHAQKNAWQWSHAFIDNSQYPVTQTWAKKFKTIPNFSVQSKFGDYGSCKGPFPPLQLQV